MMIYVAIGQTFTLQLVTIFVVSAKNHVILGEWREKWREPMADSTMEKDRHRGKKKNPRKRREEVSANSAETVRVCSASKYGRQKQYTKTMVVTE